MAGCANPNPYHPRNPDGTCFYWKCTDAAGVTHDEPQCTYWLKEAWRSNCEAAGLQQQEQDRERKRIASLTPTERAVEEGRLF